VVDLEVPDSALEPCMLERAQIVADFHPDLQLLHEFAPERGRETFSRLDVASGKKSVIGPGEMGQEEAPACDDNRTGQEMMGQSLWGSLDPGDGVLPPRLAGYSARVEFN
jgi:hypothetical protein